MYAESSGRPSPTPQPLGEADVRRVDVEHAQLDATSVAKAVQDTWRRGHEAPGHRAEDVPIDLELGLAGEHVERVDEIVVLVGSDSVEVGAKRSSTISNWGSSRIRWWRSGRSTVRRRRAEGDDAVHAPSMPGAATEGPVTLATSTGPS